MATTTKEHKMSRTTTPKADRNTQDWHQWASAHMSINQPRTPIARPEPTREDLDRWADDGGPCS